MLFSVFLNNLQLRLSFHSILCGFITLGQCLGRSLRQKSSSGLLWPVKTASFGFWTVRQLAKGVTLVGKPLVGGEWLKGNRKKKKCDSRHFLLKLSFIILKRDLDSYLNFRYCIPPYSLHCEFVSFSLCRLANVLLCKPSCYRPKKYWIVQFDDKSMKLCQIIDDLKTNISWYRANPN